MKGHDYADPLCGVEENIAYNAFLVGKRLLGMRVADVLKAVGAASGRTTAAGPAGRCAAGGTPAWSRAWRPRSSRRSTRVAVEEMPLSFWPLFEAAGRPINAASILPRLLRDFGDVAAVLAAIARGRCWPPRRPGTRTGRSSNLDPDGPEVHRGRRRAARLAPALNVAAAPRSVSVAVNPCRAENTRSGDQSVGGLPAAPGLEVRVLEPRRGGLRGGRAELADSRERHGRTPSAGLRPPPFVNWERGRRTGRRRVTKVWGGRRLE